MLCVRVCVCVCVWLSRNTNLNQLTDLHETWYGPYFIGGHHNAILGKEVSNNDIMEARTCEAGATLSTTYARVLK
jgi:hypothetical protein